MVLLDALAWLAANPDLFGEALGQHLLMCGVSLAIAVVLGIPAAVLVLGNRALAAAVINTVNAVRTIPSLAILAAALPILGIGLWPSVVALTVLALPPILLNTYVGLTGVDPDVLDAARGMGMTRRRILARVQLPLAAPSMFTGVRTAAVQVLAGATLASFIGGGGLGDFVTAGIAMMDVSRLLAGALPIAVLAIGAELLLGWTQRRLFGNAG